MLQPYNKKAGFQLIFYVSLMNFGIKFVTLTFEASTSAFYLKMDGRGLLILGFVAFSLQKYKKRLIGQRKKDVKTLKL